jgi:hypothetical protein
LCLLDLLLDLSLLWDLSLSLSLGLSDLALLTSLGRSLSFESLLVGLSFLGDGTGRGKFMGT